MSLSPEKVLPCETSWKNLKGITLSETSQKPKENYCDLSYWNVESKQKIQMH